MAVEQFANRPVTVITAGGTTAPAGGTVETWTALSSSGWPSAVTGVSQFHVTDNNAPTEIILVTNVSGTTWTVTRGAEGTTPVAHAAGFPVSQTVTAGFLGTAAAAAANASSLLNVAAYGAKCDGQAAYTGQATASSATLTDPAASFTSALAGKTFTMPGAGAAGGVWTGTITAVPSSTTLTISVTAGTSSQVASASDGAMNSASNKLSSASGAFTATWDGAIVTVAGAGPAGATLTGMVQAVADTTDLYICAVNNTSSLSNASATVSGAAYTVNRGRYWIGTDDTAAWNAALTAASASLAPRQVTWSGVSHVSTGLTVPGNVILAGDNISATNPVVTAPVGGSVLRAHGAFSGSAVATFGPGTFGYLESQVSASARYCTIDAAGIAAWAAIAAGNAGYFDHVEAMGGTSGQWQATQGQAIWSQCTGAGINAGDCLFINGANDCQWYGGFLRNGASQVHIRNASDFKMIGAHPFGGYGNSNLGSSINALIDTTGSGTCQNIAFTGCDFDDSNGPQVKIAPGASGAITEVSFTGCQFYENTSPIFTWPNNTYPVVQVDISAAGSTVSRLSIAGGSAVSNVGGSLYKSVVDCAGSSGSFSVLSLGPFTATFCSALTTGTAAVHPWLSNAASFNGTSWTIQGNPAEAGITPVNSAWKCFAVGGYNLLLSGSALSNGTNKAFGAIGEWYAGAVFVPYNCTLTGVVVAAGTTGGTDSWVVALWNSAGTALANSALAGTTAPASDTKARVAFTSPVAVTGPGLYFIGVQSNGSTATFWADGAGAGGYLSIAQTGGSIGAVPALSPAPSTYVGSVAPLFTTY